MTLPSFSSPLMQSLTVALLGSLFVLYVARRALSKQGRRVPRRVMYGFPLAVLLATFIADGMMTVDVGTVRVVSFLGHVRPQPYAAGFHVVVPGSRHYPISVRRQLFELSGGSLDAPEPAVGPAASPSPAPAVPAPSAAALEAQRTIALSLDRIPLSVDVAFPYQVSPELAWKVYAIVGLNYEQQLLMPAARAAMRDAVGTFAWTDAVTTKRAEMEERIHLIFHSLVKDNLRISGFSPDEAGKAFSLMPPQIRRLAPPRRILAAVAEARAAEEDLKRQEVLNEIAAREAERRANEGVGVRKLFDQLPKGMSTEQVRQLLYALADKQRADSLQRAVEKNQVKIIVMGGGANPQIAVPAQ